MMHCVKRKEEHLLTAVSNLLTIGFSYCLLGCSVIFVEFLFDVFIVKGCAL